MNNRALTHDEMRSAFSEIYNMFYCANRKKSDIAKCDSDWSRIIADAHTISAKYDSDIVTQILCSVIKQLEREELN